MEQVNITLSKKEKRYYFLYLLGMLFFALVIISAIVLFNVASPFSEKNDTAIRLLDEKAKFDELQKKSIKLIDSAFVKIDKLPLDSKNTYEYREIENSINDIPQSVQNNNSTDLRKESYRQIAEFYAMFLKDKEMAFNKIDNTTKYERQAERCRIGLHEKKKVKAERDLMNKK